MTIPFWCLVVAIVIPYLLTAVANYFKMRQFGYIDHHAPRAQLMALQGIGARAYAAHQNAWEALIIFGIAVIVAHQTSANATYAALASLSFIVARLLHAFFYLANLARLRQVAFLGAISCCCWLFALAAVAP